MAAEVLGDAGYAKEPRWNKVQQMSVMEFHKGLRERNWTHADYQKDASPWNVAFFEDSGRFMRPSFDGYRSQSAAFSSLPMFIFPLLVPFRFEFRLGCCLVSQLPEPIF